MLNDEYPAARAEAIDEGVMSEDLFPTYCSFTVEQVQDAEF